jgi:hypothetical protein
LAVAVRIALALGLLAAISLKLRDARASRDALGTFGVPARLRAVAWSAIVALELALAIGVAIGSDAAAYGAAALAAVFAGALAVTLARGGAGAPCGCFGAHSRVTSTGVLRATALAAVFAAVPSLPDAAPTREGWLGLALALALACIFLLAAAVLALAREVGLLRLRLGGDAALEIQAEGPPLGSRPGLSGRFRGDGGARFALAVFSSEGCHLCRALEPAIAAFARDPLVAVEVFDEVRDAEVWGRLRIPGSPFAVALDHAGAVRAKGTFNSYGQLESILATAERRLAEANA